MISLSSPAKINLFLRVVNRRPDGYHEIATLMQAIDLMDKLHIELMGPSAESDELTCTDPSLPRDASNLVIKAANLFRKKVGKSIFAKVHLEKNIPHEAGLGGGSGNAATMLWGLNELSGKPASTEDLMHWSAEIGSDIPFFFSEGVAYCTGRGEIVRKVSPFKRERVWIVKPPEGLSTPQVYKSLKLDELDPRDPEEALKLFENGDFIIFNDLELPAYQLMPSLYSYHEQIRSYGYSQVMLAGSGTSLFALGEGIAPPAIENATCYSARFCYRSSDHWYMSEEDIEACRNAGFKDGKQTS